MNVYRVFSCERKLKVRCQKSCLIETCHPHFSLKCLNFIGLTLIFGNKSLNLRLNHYYRSNERLKQTKSCPRGEEKDKQMVGRAVG